MSGRYVPLGEMMEEFLQGAFARPAFAFAKAPAEPTGRVRIDLYERNGDYVMLADLPGVKKEDIQVQVVGEEVSISAETREGREGERLLYSERALGKLARSVRLQEEIDDAQVKAKFADGVLELTLPKKANAPRKVTVQ